MLRTYDKDYVPDVCGFVNTGVICYLNTMMQVLLSCSAFNQHLLERKDLFVKAAANGNKIGLLYIKILEENGMHISANGQLSRDESDQFSVKQCNASILLRELIDLRKRNRSTSNLLHHHQEGFHEGLTFLIEALTDVDPTVADVFNIRYTMDIICRNPKCRHRREGPKEKPNIMFNLFEEDPILQDALDNKEKIEDYIKQHINIPDDYKCDKCEAKNNVVDGRVTPNVQQIYRLARISSVIVLVFNKYEEKKLKYFPPTLDFGSKDGNLHYELIAQVEHYGTRTGGHYLTKCRRPTPNGFGTYVANKKNKVLKAELDQFTHRHAILSRKKAAGDVRPELGQVLHQLEQKIAQIRTVIDNVPNFGDMLALHLNDSSVSVDPNGLQPTKNTYIAVYHLV